MKKELESEQNNQLQFSQSSDQVISEKDDVSVIVKKLWNKNNGRSLSSKQDIDADQFEGENSIKIFNVYLKTHIGPPEGSRKPDDSSDEIDLDVQVSDRELYADELST